VRVLAALVVVAFVVLALWWVPRWQVPSDPELTSRERFDVENAARVTLAQVLGGFALLLALYFTWRRVGAAERAVRATEEGQITERFANAIDHLGSERLEVRLGGIYALERIARDSERDHWQIMEVLTAFVRERAPAPTDADMEWENEAEARGDDVPLPSPKPDVQAILDVIGRREVSESRERARVLDLRSCDLRRAEMRGARLDRVDLRRTNLWEADLRGARFHLANLESAVLNAARLEGADLSGAIFSIVETSTAATEDPSVERVYVQWVLAQAITDGKTRLPQVLRVPSTAER
jgi:hypothetical protein